MKILQISRQFPPVVGGIQASAYGLTRALSQKGYHVDVVTLNSDFSTGETLAPEDVIEGIRVTRIPYFGSKRYPIAPQLFRYISQYDVLHVHAIDYFIDALSLTRWWHQKPIIVTTHGGIFHTQWMATLKKMYFQSLTRLSLQGAKSVICVSKHDFDIFKSIAPESKLHVLMGIDLDAFLTIKKQVEPGLLLGIGRVSENKRIDRIISLLPKLADQFSNIKLLWIGNNPEQLVPTLMQQAQDLGVASRVTFLGQVADAEMQGLLARAHLFVSASAHEGFGISTIEAMCSGTVPVVTPVGIHPDVVRDHETGFIYQFDEQIALSKFRQALSLDETHLAQIGENARKVAYQFSWNQVVESYIDIYKNSLSTNGIKT